MTRFLSVVKKYWKLGLLGCLGLGIIGLILRFTILKPQPHYQTALVEKRNLVKTLEVSGEIEADEKASLKFQTSGKLAWIGVKEGDSVKKWQAVASLDKSILRKNVASALNDYMHQRWDFDQIREDNLVTTDNYDDYSFTNTIERLIEQEQFLLNKEVLDVEIAAITEKLATIASPIDGIVTEISKPLAGVNVYVTDTIMEIVNSQSLYFEAEVDEIDIGLIQENQLATIILDAYEDEPFSSQVQAIDFQASTSDSGGTVFLVRFLLPVQDSLKYRLGMNGEVAIEVAQKPAVLSIPFEAIKTINDQTFAQILTDAKKPLEKEIQIGLETDDYVEVLAGLNEGEVVITGIAD